MSLLDPLYQYIKTKYFSDRTTISFCTDKYYRLIEYNHSGTRRKFYNNYDYLAPGAGWKRGIVIGPLEFVFGKTG